MTRIIDRLRTRTAAFIHDLLMIPLAWIGSYWLRFNMYPIPEYMFSEALRVLPLIVLVQGSVLWYFGLYRGVWRFASMPDLIRILNAVIVGIALSVLLMFFFTRMQYVPRSVFPLYGLLLIVSLGGPRLTYRWWKDRQLHDRAAKKVLIVGAGQAGELLVRDLFRDKEHDYVPIAFVDDNATKKGREIHGVRVLGDCERIPSLAATMRIDVILLALPSATSREMRRVVKLCDQAGVLYRTLPRIQDFVAGRTVLRELREVSIVDLLGREPVSLDWASIREGIFSKVVLVSGGGGSIGSELCRQLARLKPDALVIFDNSELNLYRIELELENAFPGVALTTILGDVCDLGYVDQVVLKHRPDLIFHAAAYKQVPLLESQSRAAVRNNVLGTQNVASCAALHDCEAFVLISTDKAVNPSNAMGASKRVAEMLCQRMDLRDTSTRFITVRFGNVLDSAGSVVPLFRKQIASGGPVTVTHPEVERYFMTIPEACQLILEAAVIGHGGEIFVLDMGEPVKIRYLAEQMIALAGKALGEDIEIEYTELRAGEKLSEELFHAQEKLTATRHKKILLARNREVDWNSFEKQFKALVSASEGYDDASVRTCLTQLVPELKVAHAKTADNVILLESVNR